MPEARLFVPCCLPRASVAIMVGALLLRPPVSTWASYAALFGQQLTTATWRADDDRLAGWPGSAASTD